MNIVFDFGAVLFTWQPAELIKTHFSERAATPEQAAELARAVFGHADWHDFDRGVVLAHTVSERIAARVGLPEGRLRTLIDGIAEHLQPMPDSVALLAQLRALRDKNPSRLQLYFLSNMPAPYARELLAKHPFMSWFDGGIFSGDVHHIKPEAEIYQLLEDHYALVPGDTVFIDDLANNVSSAQARGWQGIHFTSATQLQAQLMPLLMPLLA